MARKKTGGKKSKRISCSKRYKIEKKVRDHNRKIKKKTEKEGTSKHRSKKDPGVPNNCPFKEEVLKEAERIKALREKERKEKMQRRKENRQKLHNQNRSISQIAADAAEKLENFEKQNKFVEEKSKIYGSDKAVENSLKAFYREVKKVIEEADVVIQVLDARDPLGSRCAQIEETILSSGPKKKLILLLNKIDLVPKENVEKWLKYLRNEFPTVAFKACTQSQTDRLSHSKVLVADASNELLQSSRCLGADVLMNLLSNYCRNQDIKTSITIGIIGFPNTGKSSVINSLKRSKACHVGATPGVTKAMQTVQLDKHIKLLDSPGVVMTTDMTSEAVILHNCVKVESIEDPVKPVEVILSRITKKQIAKQYGVEDFADVGEFLLLLAKRTGKLKKGGIPDVDKVARSVVQDWNCGKLKYSTEPPETYTRSSYITAEVVSQMSQAFDIDALLRDERSTVEVLKPESESNELMSVDQPAGLEDNSDDESDMEEETAGNVAGKQQNMQTKKAAPMPLPGNRQLNKDRKKAFKKAKKTQRRADALASFFGEKVAMNDDGDDSYNFETDY